MELQHTNVDCDGTGPSTTYNPALDNSIPSLAERRRDSLTHLATTALLAFIGCPTRYVGYVAAYVALADGDTDFYPCADYRAGLLMGGPRSRRGAKRRTVENRVRDVRPSFETWQKKSGHTLIETAEGEFNPETGKNDPMRVRVPCLLIITAIRLAIEERLRDEPDGDPLVFARQETARIAPTMGAKPSQLKIKPDSQATSAATLNSYVRSYSHKAIQHARTKSVTDERDREHVVDAVILANALAAIGAIPPKGEIIPRDESDGALLRGMSVLYQEAQRRGIADEWLASIADPEAPEEEPDPGTGTGLVLVNQYVPPAQDAEISIPCISTGMAIPAADDPEPTLEVCFEDLEVFEEGGTQKGEGGSPMSPPSNVERIAEAQAAIALFASVGATDALLVYKNDVTLEVSDERGELGDISDAVPAILASADRDELSVCIRPSTGSSGVYLCQLDDITVESAVAVTVPFAFMIAETSSGSWQSWIAVAGVQTKQDRDTVRARLLVWLQALDPGANAGAGGSIRMPGSRNFKHDPAPIVRMIHTEPGAIWTVEQLETIGVLPELPPPPVLPPSRVSAAAEKRGFPDYQRCLSDAPVVQKGSRQGMPDRSVADYRFVLLSRLRGWDQGRVDAELHRVSEKWRQSPESYRRLTLSNAGL